MDTPQRNPYKKRNKVEAQLEKEFTAMDDEDGLQQLHDLFNAHDEINALAA